MKVTEALAPLEIQALAAPSNARGWLAVATTWAMIGASLLAAGLWPSIWTIAPALVILGGRHLALAILMHDCAHYSLFRTRWLNDWIGRWLCAYPTWQDLGRYRGHHLRHHRQAGSAEDPDLDLVAPFPISRASLARKLARDLCGLSGLKRIYGLLLMELGFVEYTVSSKLVPAARKSFARRLSLAVANLHGVVLTNLALFALLAALGSPWLYGLWVASWLTTFSVFVRIRSIAEHACTGMGLDPMQNTRTTHANPMARVTVAPHRVNYHLEHHLLPNVPSFRLPEMHRMLIERRALEHAHLARGYGQVLKLATLRG